MSQIYINTAQNVRIEQIPASVAERILAQLIDYALFGGYAMIFLLLIGSVVQSTFYLIIAALPILFYDLVCEITMNGQSAGKRVMGIRVVRDDGSEPDIQNYIIRWVFRIFDTIGSFGSVATITSVVNGQGKRLGDIVAGTRVIRIKREDSDKVLLPSFAKDYNPIFPQAVNLSEKDIEIIREVLGFAGENPNSPPSDEMLKKMKNHIENKLGIRSDWYHFNFLDRIVKDYTYLSLHS